MNLSSFYQVLDLGVDKLRNYWNRDNFDLAMYVESFSLVSTRLNLCVQQVLAVTTYGYHSQFAWVSFAAAFFHLLGTVSSHFVNHDRLQRLNSLMALLLFGLTGYSINFECDIRVPAFFLCVLMRMAFEAYDLIPEYYLLLDGKILPLSLISTVDVINKLKVREEDSHVVKLDPNVWFKVREDHAHLVKFEPDNCQEVVLSVLSVQEGIIKFTVTEYQAHLLRLVHGS